MPTQIMVFKPPEGASAEVLRDILNAIIGAINATTKTFGLGEVIAGQYTVKDGVGELPLFSTVKLGKGGISGIVQAVAIIIASLTFLKFEIDVIEPAVKGEVIPLVLLAGGGVLLFLFLTRGRRR